MLKSKTLMWALFLIFFSNLPGCDRSASDQDSDTNYIAEIQEWQRERIAGLKSETGWLNLAGLYWLKEGENTFGSDPENDLVFPEKAPKLMGAFVQKNTDVSVKIVPGAGVTHEGRPVTHLKVYTAGAGERTVLQHGSLAWFVIERDGMLGVRLRDLENPALSRFKGIDRYDIDPKWKIAAELRPYASEKIVEVPTVLNTVRKQASPGALIFKVNGETYTLDSVSENNSGQVFVIFADKTTGVETYSGGRFLYVDKPGEDGKTFIDFNKAYNPPCAFSAFSTCPLPPAQNRLPFAVTAGEKMYEYDH
ncbi:MAG: DUF1684 domain-containing protein [bacterium]